MSSAFTLKSFSSLRIPLGAALYVAISFPLFSQEVVHFKRAASVTLRELADLPPVRLHRSRQHADRTPLPRLALTSISEAEVNFTAKATIAAPAVITGFRSNRAQVMDPPDSSGAVGKHHVVGLSNEGFVIQARNGANLHEALLTQFWFIERRLDVYDPRIVYDIRADRWITMAIIDEREIAIAVSRTGDPAGPWDRWYLNQPTADFSRLVLTRDTVIFATHVGDREALVFSVSKKALYDAPESLPVRKYPAFIGVTPVSAPDDAVEYVVMPDNGSISVKRLESTSWLKIQGSFAWYGTYWIARQKGSSRLLECGFGWMEDATYRNGFLYAVQTGIAPQISNNASGIVWWKLRPDTGTNVQIGFIGDGAGVVNRAYPSHAVNDSGAMLIAYSRLSADEYPSAAATYVDSAGLMSEERMLKAGESPGAIFSGRWGDYTTTILDPNGTDFWTAQIYGVDQNWSTWWSHVSRSKGRQRSVRH